MFIVINLATAECETGFESEAQAKDFIKSVGIPELKQSELDDGIDLGEVERTLIMPYFINDTEEPNEITVYSNADKESKFSSVAEYYEDTLTEDFISTQDTPIRLQIL